MTAKTIAPPKALKAAGAQLWRSIARQWSQDDLTPDARELRLLADACSEADLLAALTVELDAAMAEGRLTVKGSQGQPVTHPHVSETRRSRAQIAALLLKLGLEEQSAGSAVPIQGMSAAEAGRLGGLARRKVHG